MSDRKRTRALDSRGRPVRGIYIREGRYVAGYMSRGKWQMETLTAETLTEARQERDSLLAGLREGRRAAPSEVTVRELFDDWQSSRSISDRTRENEQQVFEKHMSTLGRRRAQEVTATMVAAILRDLRDKPYAPGKYYSEWRRNHVLRVLRGTFAHGVRRGALTRNPTDGLAPSELPKQRNARRHEAVDAKKLSTLVDSAQTDRWKVALGLAAFAGLRLGELRGLTWWDIDLPAGTLTVTRSLLPDGSPKPPKSAAGVRTVPLVPELRRLLVAWRLRSPHTRPGDFVLCTAEGAPVEQRNVRRALDAAKEKAGLDETEGRLSPHTLRHAYCSALATAGLAPTTLARITGHSDPGFTLKAYARDTRDDAALVADVLARAASAGLGG